MGFMTSTAIVCSSFLLGVLFTGLVWDQTLLFNKVPINEAALQAVEAYYLTWWHGAMTVKIFFHIVMIALFVALTAKFARKSDTAFYFSGASLLLLVLCSSVYLVITLPSIRLIAKDPIDRALAQPVGNDTFTRLQAFFAKKNSGDLGNRARHHAAALMSDKLMSLDERIEHDSVMCAGNILLMMLLSGIILLQISEWSLEDTMLKEEKEALQKQSAPVKVDAAAPATAVAPVPVTAEKKKQ